MLQRAASTSSLSHSSSHNLPCSVPLCPTGYLPWPGATSDSDSEPTGVSHQESMLMFVMKKHLPHLTSGFPLFSPQEQGFCCLCLSSPLRECHSLSEVLSKRDKRNSLHAVNSNVCLDMKTSGVFYTEREKSLQCLVQTC